MCKKKVEKKHVSFIAYYVFNICCRSMLNCVNALEHIQVTEQAGLVVTEEKAHHDSCESNLFSLILL